MEKKIYIAPELDMVILPQILINPVSNMHTSDQDADPTEDMLSKDRFGWGDDEDFMDEEF